MATAEENLRNLLSNVAGFQTSTGTATAASAAGFIGIPNDPIHDDGSTITNSDFRAAIGEDGSASVRSAGTGGAVSGGTIPLAFYEGIGSAESEESAFTTFKQQIADITQGMKTLEGPYLILQDVEAREHPMRTRPERGDGTNYFVGEYDVTHGVDAP